MEGGRCRAAGHSARAARRALYHRCACEDAPQAQAGVDPPYVLLLVARQCRSNVGCGVLLQGTAGWAVCCPCATPHFGRDGGQWRSTTGVGRRFLHLSLCHECKTQPRAAHQRAPGVQKTAHAERVGAAEQTWSSRADLNQTRSSRGRNSINFGSFITGAAAARR